MKVLLAGASGLIGGALAQSLSGDGHEVRRLVRRPAAGPTEFSWHPEDAELDPASLDGVDSVVCLSGAGVADHRWTDAYRRTIRDSRISTVATLAEAIAAIEGPRASFLSASAVGYYGDTGDRETDENGPNGSSFLAGVCRDWENAASAAVDAGARVVHLRTGLVLTPEAGLLAKLAPLVKLGVGGKLGSGRQYWPWISLTDQVGAIRFLLTAGQVSGPVNLTGPAPVTNAEFTAILARVLHRPAIVPTPGFALRIALGGFAEDVLASQRVVPAALTAAGFSFTHADVETALRAMLAL
jgi:uncharacterized protein (TIGR01777 family)